MFDYNRDGFLAPEELFGGMTYVGIDVEAQDILEFIRIHDQDNDGNLNYREFLDIVVEQDSVTQDTGEEDAIPGPKIQAEIERIPPRGKEELYSLLLKMRQEEKEMEEHELKLVQEKENQIAEKIKKEELEEDLKQEGGPNPKIDFINGEVFYDFALNRRPRGITSRGDWTLQSEKGENLCLLYPGAALFLPVPVSSAADPLSIYTISMEILLNELPTPGSSTALVQMSGSSSDPASFYLLPDGSVGMQGGLGTKESSKIAPKKWVYLMISVNLFDNIAVTYVNGKLSQFIASPSLCFGSSFTIIDQIALFHSKFAEESRGSKIRFCKVESLFRSQEEAEGIYALWEDQGMWICDVIPLPHFSPHSWLRIAQPATFARQQAVLSVPRLD